MSALYAIASCSGSCRAVMRLHRQHLGPLTRVGIFTACIMLAVAVLQAGAADYYFAEHGKDRHDCQQEKPCRSLKKLNALLKKALPGDAFFLRGGDRFNGKGKNCIVAKVDGAPGRPIRIASTNSKRPTLVNCAAGVMGKRIDWWVVDGLEIKKSHRGILCPGCRDWVVRDVVMHDIGQVCVLLKAFATRWHLQDITCHDTGTRGRNGEGIYIVDGQDITIENSEFYRLTDEGVNCKGATRGLIVRGNYFHNFLSTSRVASQGFLTRMVAWLTPPNAHAGMNKSEDTAVNCRFPESTDILVECNVIENMPHTGVRMHNISNAVTRHNLIINTKIGIDYGKGTTGQIEGNFLYANARPYKLDGTSVAPEHDTVSNEVPDNTPLPSQCQG